MGMKKLFGLKKKKGKKLENEEGATDKELPQDDNAKTKAKRIDNALNDHASGNLTRKSNAVKNSKPPKKQQVKKLKDEINYGQVSTPETVGAHDSPSPNEKSGNGWRSRPRNRQPRNSANEMDNATNDVTVFSPVGKHQLFPDKYNPKNDINILDSASSSTDMSELSSTPSENNGNLHRTRSRSLSTSRSSSRSPSSQARQDTSMRKSRSKSTSSNSFQARQEAPASKKSFTADSMSSTSEKLSASSSQKKQGWVSQSQAGRERKIELENEQNIGKPSQLDHMAQLKTLGKMYADHNALSGVHPRTKVSRGGKGSSEIDRATTSEDVSMLPSSTSPMKEIVQNHRTLVQVALGRPFGRDYIPRVAKKWIVQVDDPILDKENQMWIYKIYFERCTPDAEDNIDSDHPELDEIMTLGQNTSRTLQDLYWLEDALVSEYAGSLLLPKLKSYCNSAQRSAGPNNTTHKVEPSMLQAWLNDVVNGIRGNGEVLLTNVSKHDLFKSESMERFLFQSGSLCENHLTNSPRRRNNRDRAKSPDLFSARNDDSLVKKIMGKSVFACVSPDASSGMMPNCASPATHTDRNALGYGLMHDHDLQLDTHDPDNNAPTGPLSFNTVLSRVQPETLEVHRYFSSYYRKFLPKFERKLSILVHQETLEGKAWKRFAISLSNLFAIEREIAESRVAPSFSNAEEESRKFKNMKKELIDDGLRLLVRQKMDRATLPLQCLKKMTDAFKKDMDAIPRSLDEYSYAIEILYDTLEPNGSPNSQYEASKQSNSVESKEMMKQFMFNQSAQLKAIASQKIDTVKKSFESYNSGEVSGKTFLTNVTSPTLATNTSTRVSFSSQNKLVSPKERDFMKKKLTENGAQLCISLEALCKSTPIRMARMSWAYFKMEARQTTLLRSAAASLKSKALSHVATQEVQERQTKLEEEKEEDDAMELTVMKKMLELGGNWCGESDNLDDSNALNNEHRERMRSQACERAYQMARGRVGRWDANLALAVMEAGGIGDAEVRVEETTRDLRHVRKCAIGLRGSVDRCVEALDALQSVIQGNSNDNPSQMQKSHTSGAGENKNTFVNINRIRQGFLSSAATMFSCSMQEKHHQNKKTSLYKSILDSAGIDTNDPAGWVPSESNNQRHRGNCGTAAYSYFKVREINVSTFISRVHEVLTDYEHRVEGIESFVYINCVGIQLEKHYSNRRAEALAAWEKKTDVTAAINIAKRKKLPKLVSELEEKLQSISTNASHTSVKQAKERHLVSKALKSDFQNLANRRFRRAKESATERLTTLLRLWADYEEAVAFEELKGLDRTILEIERMVQVGNIEADGGAHLFSIK